MSTGIGLMRTSFFKLLSILTVAGIVVCLSVILVNRWNPYKKNTDAVYLTLLREAYAAVNRSYVEKPDGKKLVQSMVDGMLASLDPHSAYLPPEPYKEMEVQIAGAFGGVGIELGMKNGKLTAIAPIDDTPAFRAGIQPNDHIWKIDGTVTTGMAIPAAVKLMRGEKGTPVSLAILRNNSPRPMVFNLIRDVIKMKSLKARTLEPGYAMIRISQFQERTGSDFRQALKDLRAASGGGLKGLVLDLRYNPGGLVSSSVEVANCFIGDDINATLIVSTKGRMRNANDQMHATVGEKEPHYPMVVLINGGSASASEIVAGALQDHKRAIVMGRQSFGKGSVQSIIPMRGHAALKLTTARYYTPSGRSIQAKGITPDIEVGMAKPIEKNSGKPEGIKENDLANRLPPEGKDAAGKPAALPPPKDSFHGGVGEPDVAGDYQLNRALDLLRSLTQMREQGFMSKK